MGRRGKKSSDKRRADGRFDEGLNPFGDSGSWNPDARVRAVGGGGRPKFKDKKELSGSELMLFFFAVAAVIATIMILFNL